MRLQPHPLLALLLAMLGLQSCVAPEVSLTPMLAATRMDPPMQGKNKVWVEYQDLTAQGDDFEDEIWEGLHEALEDRGYVLVNFPDEADYVLWATTRTLDRVEGEEDFNRTLTGLGAVAGGVGGAAVGDTVAGRTGATVGAIGGAGIGGYAMAKLTEVDTFICVVDLQLGSRRAEAVNYSEATSTSSGSTSSTAAGVSQSGGVGAPERAASSTGGGSAAEFVRESFFAEKEQRLLITSKGTRMNQDQAKELMIPKLIDGVKAQLPRYRGDRGEASYRADKPKVNPTRKPNRRTDKRRRRGGSS